MSKQLKEIQEILLENAAPETKKAQQKFIPGVTKTYGVKNPVLNELAALYKDAGFELAEELWRSGSIEERQIAGKLLGKISKKDPGRSIQFIKQVAADIDNWAVCDCLGMQSLKPIVKTHHKEIFAMAEHFNHSQNLWERRLSLVLVEWYTREKKFHPRILQLIKNLENDNEYYVKKAVLWIKRNFTKGR